MAVLEVMSAPAPGDWRLVTYSSTAPEGGGGECGWARRGQASLGRDSRQASLGRESRQASLGRDSRQASLVKASLVRASLFKAALVEASLVKASLLEANQG